MTGFFQELRRRKVFRMAGFYIVGAWLVMQAADVFFPGWGLPDAALNVLLIAAVLGFPLALVFGWFYDVTTHGVLRTPPADHGDSGGTIPLQRTDYLVLASLAGIAVFIVFRAGSEIVETPRVETEASTAAPISEAPPPEKLPNSIAVLPFDNLSNDPDNEVFCDGISEEIINKLGTFEELRVIGRTTTFALKGGHHTLPQISDLTGARFLLQGSVRMQGDRLRISAQLVDETGTQQWSDTFDRNLEDVFAIQSEIGAAVATTIAPQIAGRSKETYKPDIEAYQHYLAGRELVRKRDVVAAREQLDKAIEIDPAYAAAYAERAISRLVRIPVREDVDLAGRDIDVALALQPDLPRGLAARGLWLSNEFAADDEASAESLREALKRQPGMVDAKIWLAGALSKQGRHREADAQLLEAYEIDPLNAAAAANMANYYGDRGEIAKAEQILLKLVELPEPPRFAFMGLGSIYRETGRLVEMNAIAKRLALTGLQPYYRLAMSYALLGQSDKAEYWAVRADRDFPDYFWSGFFMPLIRYYNGDYVGAVEAFDRALEVRGIDLADSQQNQKNFAIRTRALSGQCPRAVETVQVAFGSLSIDAGDGSAIDTGQALAWCYDSLGQPEAAEGLLVGIEGGLAKREERYGFLDSPDTYALARNAAITGDSELALERLQRAIDLGWREYYISDRDPRWATLKEDPRYQALMARVKDDVDRQRAEVEQLDTEEDFPALLDQVRAARQK